MYDGDFSNTDNSTEVLTGTSTLVSNFTDRYGRENMAVTLDRTAATKL